MDFGGKKISREVLEKLAKCQSEEEVIALAKESKGFYGRSGKF